jgi:hypothetical protein
MKNIVIIKRIDLTRNIMQTIEDRDNILSLK